MMVFLCYCVMSRTGGEEADEAPKKVANASEDSTEMTNTEVTDYA